METSYICVFGFHRFSKCQTWIEVLTKTWQVTVEIIVFPNVKNNTLSGPVFFFLFYFADACLCMGVNRNILLIDLVMVTAHSWGVSSVNRLAQ